MQKNLKDIVGKIIKKECFKLLLFACLLLAGLDLFLILKFGDLAGESRVMVCTIVLLLISVIIEEHFWVWAILLLLPNSLFAFFLATFTSNYRTLLGTGASQILLIAIFSGFHYILNRSYIHENSFNTLKQEVKDHKDNSMANLLHFSLLGCLREHNRIISQAYHVLENHFKADMAVIFLSDYENNTLVPVFKMGEVASNKFQPILVKPDFFTKHAFDPEKGVLSVISGACRIPSLRELIPQAGIDAIAAMPVSSDNRVAALVTIIKQKSENRQLLDPARFATFCYVLGASLENCAVHEYRNKMLKTAEESSQNIRTAFGKYVSDAVVDQLINNREIATLGGRKMKVSIMMADLRGFTSLSSVLPIEKLVQLLNTWFDRATDLILKSHGTIDKYMGDCVMVIFGAPMQKPDDVLRCVYTGFRLMERFKEFQKVIELPPGHELGLGISISTGEAIVGNFGSSNRMEYTAIGETVNLASRLEKLANSGEIVVDANTFTELPVDRFRYECESNVKIKGLANQTIYKLCEVLKNQPKLPD